MMQYRRVYASVDLDAVVFNMNSMRNNIPQKIKMAAVVKTDGYGHGAVPVAKAVSDFVAFYCVATVEEALSLRMHHITKPILVLGPVPGDEYEDMVSFDIRPSVFTLEQAEALNDAAAVQQKTAYVHLAVDTGMNRIGMKPTEESAAVAAKIAALPNIKIEGVFTHMYNADGKDLSSAEKQAEIFKNFLGMLKEKGIEPKIRHISNSAGIIENLGTDLDMVRAGITMYGIYPSEETDRTKIRLKPVLSMKSRISFVKEIKAGDSVSYGGTFTAEKAMRVATIPVGYGDGYPRTLSNCGYILIDGKRAHILGRVCMDQFMVDVTDIPAAKTGLPVTLIGDDGADTIRVEDLSRLCGRFPYEFLCDIGKRVPRVYLKGGREIGHKDYFMDFYQDFTN